MPVNPSSVTARMAAMRAAFQCQRQARRYRGAWLFHCEFRRPEAARNARVLMIWALRASRREWRLALGLPWSPQAAPVEPPTPAAVTLPTTGW